MTNGEPHNAYSRDLLDIVKFAVTLFIVVLVFMWTAILLAATGFSNRPHTEINSVLLLFALSLALDMCNIVGLPSSWSY
jgi:hypothetical protein